MGFWNIAIPTGILWVLTILVVLPLTNYLLSRQLKKPEYAHLNVEDPEKLTEAEKAKLQSMYTKYFIATDVVVLGLAGFIGGLLGYLLIGISLDTKGWPGMIAFISGSLLGTSMVA